MALDQSIELFPADIDRNLFGATVSGISDGEACFFLGFHKNGKRKTPNAYFTIGLRSDDMPILRLIQSFFGCGGIYVVHSSPGRKGSKPVARLTIQNLSDVADIVSPHFERYPLYSKKAKDFVIWKEGIAMIREARSTPLVRAKSNRIFWLPRWTKEQIDRFSIHVDALRESRKFNAATVPVPSLPKVYPQQPSLFD